MAGFGVGHTLTHSDHFSFRTSLHSVSDSSRSRRSEKDGFMTFGSAALSASVFAGLDLLRAGGGFVRAP